LSESRSMFPLKIGKWLALLTLYLY